MSKRPIESEESALYNRHVLRYIHRAAEQGLYDIRGLGAKRSVPSFDDLVFLTASLSRYPLRGTGRSVSPKLSSEPALPKSRLSWRFPSRSRA